MLARPLQSGRRAGLLRRGELAELVQEAQVRLAYRPSLLDSFYRLVKAEIIAELAAESHERRCCNRGGPGLASLAVNETPAAVDGRLNEFQALLKGHARVAAILEDDLEHL